MDITHYLVEVHLMPTKIATDMLTGHIMVQKASPGSSLSDQMELWERVLEVQEG